LAGQFGGRFPLITAATLQALGPGHGFELADLGDRFLRGRSAPVRVYAVRKPDGGGPNG